MVFGSKMLMAHNWKLGEKSYQEYVEIHSRCMRQLGLPVRPGNQLGQQSHGFWAKSGLCISFDPLDGSSNIIAAVSTGSIKAGYCMYWSSVIFVIMHGEFVLTQENIEIPRTGKIYSFKEENYRFWSEIFTGICCTVGFMGAAKSKNGMLKLFYECAPKSFMLNKVEENDHMVTREYYIQPTKLISKVWVSSDKKNHRDSDIYINGFRFTMEAKKK
ncbi:hypothetical protein Bca52824_040467 [Brassica carinata]|uniref:Fructose-bisphosphatase n=1 Tax=Brassica carinata TaxID=52824 RepID=A0A8X7RR21_BRACI|nr:hypothetical protein Bca52824_040467 [Brassica carinata]